MWFQHLNNDTKKRKKIVVHRVGLDLREKKNDCFPEHDLNSQPSIWEAELL